MKTYTRNILIGIFCIMGSLTLYARTYEVERGDTWELIARKWGVYVDALKAVNPGVTDVFVGYELNLPESAESEKEESKWVLDKREREDESLTKAYQALQEENYGLAKICFENGMWRNNKTTARLSFLHALCSEKNHNYLSSYKSYQNAADLCNKGDITLGVDQMMSLNESLDRVRPLAEQEERERIIQEEKRKAEEEERRRRQAIAAEVERKRKAERRAQWLNLGINLLRGVSQGLQMVAQTHATPSSSTNCYSGSSYNPRTNSFDVPSFLDPARYVQGINQTEVTTDASGNLMFRNTALANNMLQLNAEAAAYARQTAATVGGSEGYYLNLMADLQTREAMTYAGQMANWHYAPTQEELDEAREIARQKREDFREQSSGKDRVDVFKIYQELKYGDGSSSTTSNNSTSNSNNANTENSNKSKADSKHSENSRTTQNQTSVNGVGKNPDSKEQFKTDPVYSGDYRRIKSIDLYFRDGDKARKVNLNAELCKKGAYLYVKIGDVYYPRRSPNWLRFRNAISYGHEQYYFND